MIEIQAENIKKVFNRRIIFSKVNFNLKDGDGLGIIGRNGSGKTTLVKIISGLFESSEGKISYFLNSSKINNEHIYKHLGFVSPYLNLYDEFTALENLKIFDKIRNSKKSDEKYNEILHKTNLINRCNDYVRIYSSGMKQRLKYALAILNHPSILVLDEPTSNLDSEGIEMTRIIMENQRKNGILVIATNDASDLRYCNYIIDLNKN